MRPFLELLGMDVRSHTKQIQGFAYLPWALALSMAGRPAHDVVTFKVDGQDSPARRLFGGAAVAVDMEVGDGTDARQRTYLPVLNARGEAMEWSQIDGRDIGDTISRCIARAVAMVHGYGLSLYSLTEGDGVAYVDALNVTPETPDLSQVRELRDIKEFKDRKTGRVTRTQEYLGWHAPLAACRITDPGFRWEIVECETAHPKTGEIISVPAMRSAGKGWVVGVRVFYKGRVHTQWRPIMGVETVQTRNGPKPMEHQPIDNPNVFDWHSAVMRALAKGLAIVSGYGIACYAGDHAAPGAQELPEDAGLLDEPPAPPVQQSRSSNGNGSGNGNRRDRPRQPRAPERGRNRDKLISQITVLIGSTKTEKAKFTEWLGVESLAKADDSVLERGLEALEHKLQQQQQQEAATRH